MSDAAPWQTRGRQITARHETTPRDGTRKLLQYRERRARWARKDIERGGGEKRRAGWMEILSGERGLRTEVIYAISSCSPQLLHTSSSATSCVGGGRGHSALLRVCGETERGSPGWQDLVCIVLCDWLSFILHVLCDW